MKVLMVGQIPDRPDCPNGGVEAATMSLAGGLSRRDDIELVLLSMRPGTVGQTVEKGEYGTVIRVGLGARWRSAYARRRALARTLALTAPDIVHFQGTAAIAAPSDVASVVTLHGDAHLANVYSRPWWRRVVREFVHVRPEIRARDRARALILVSNWWLTVLPEAPKRRTWVIENCVARAFQASTVEPMGKRVLFVGRVSLLKNVHLLLDAFARTLANDEKAELVIAGECPDPAYLRLLESMASSAGITDRVHFVGARSQTQIASMLAGTWVLVLPSNVEAAPMAVAEAFTVGVPVIATRVGGIDDMVSEGVNGILVEPGDIDGLASALRDISNPGTRALLASGTRIPAGRFAPERVAEMTVRVYRELLDARKSNRSRVEGGEGA